ncbi:MAG: divalent-cation tolerance protein CutA [Polaromonas sp.]
MQPSTNPNPPYCLVLTTLATQEQAQTLARQLVEAQLAACVQLQPIHSVYRWKDAVCAEAEWQLAIKTRSALFEPLAAFLAAHHPYETPEIVQLPITGGSSDYLHWLDEATQATQPPTTP